MTVDVLLAIIMKKNLPSKRAHVNNISKFKNHSEVSETFKGEEGKYTHELISLRCKLHSQWKEKAFQSHKQNLNTMLTFTLYQRPSPGSHLHDSSPPSHRNNVCKKEPPLPMKYMWIRHKHTSPQNSQLTVTNPSDSLEIKPIQD